VNARQGTARRLRARIPGGERGEQGGDRWRVQTGGGGIRSIAGGANKKADTTFSSIGFMCLAA